MINKEKNGLHYLQFPNLAKFPELDHGIFTRKGGFSKNSYKGLNVGLNIGDDEESVLKNRDLISETMECEDIVFAKQIHGNDFFLYSDEPEKSYYRDNSELIEGDGLITDKIKKLLLIKVADCQPVILYDPVKKVVANIHSGWKGSINNIIGRGVVLLKEKYSSNPIDIVAGIGPSLGPCCCEFINYKSEIPEEFWKYKDEKDHFDFWRISSDQLLNSGVLKENIWLSGICTKCNSDRFFSYRNENETGRFGCVVCLK